MNKGGTSSIDAAKRLDTFITIFLEAEKIYNNNNTNPENIKALNASYVKFYSLFKMWDTVRETKPLWINFCDTFYKLTKTNIDYNDIFEPIHTVFSYIREFVLSVEYTSAVTIQKKIQNFYNFIEQADRIEKIRNATTVINKKLTDTSTPMPMPGGYRKSRRNRRSKKARKSRKNRKSKSKSNRRQ